MNEKKFNGFETLQIHAGQTPDPTTKSRAVPLYLTTSYTFDSVDDGADIFALKKEGNIYSRIMNPTNDVFENRIAALEGGVGALATASGSAAVLYAILNIARAGDEIVSASSIYGGTFNMFKNILPRFGINVRMADSDDMAAIEAAVTDKTVAIYTETIGNPNGNVTDIDAVSAIAEKYKIFHIVDSTFTTPYLLKPFEHGAHVVIHSATKFIGGHGTVVGGVIVDSGKYDFFGSGKFRDFIEPDSSYHGVVFAKDFGNAGYIARCRTQVMRDTGACLSPFHSFLFLQGLETLSLRMERHTSNAVAVAEFLAAHPKVEWVNYPTLKGNKYKPLADRILPRGAGSIFSFGIRGGIEAGKRFINSLNLFSHLANVADAKSLVIHPASTTHSQLSESELISAGVRPEAIRLSIGIETVGDIIADLSDALDRA